MMKQLLKQIYNERRSNAFLWIELLLVFVVLYFSPELSPDFHDRNHRYSGNETPYNIQESSNDPSYLSKPCRYPENGNSLHCTLHCMEYCFERYRQIQLPDDGTNVRLFPLKQSYHP